MTEAGNENNAGYPETLPLNRQHNTTEIPADEIPRYISPIRKTG